MATSGLQKQMIVVISYTSFGSFYTQKHGNKKFKCNLQLQAGPLWQVLMKVYYYEFVFINELSEDVFRTVGMRPSFIPRFELIMGNELIPRGATIGCPLQLKVLKTLF